jgi:hypothetical protein
MALDRNTIPQVLYNTPDPFTKPSELYVINGTILESATDPIKRWVVKEEHGYWDESAKAFENRARTLYPSEAQHCLPLDEVFEEIKKQVMVRVRHGFKYQLEWDPFAQHYYRKFKIQPDGTRTEY